jgi:hypothetical protein
MKFLVRERYAVRSTAEKKSHINTIVIGLSDSFASLYQMNDKAQKIIASTTEMYVFRLLFKIGIFLRSEFTKTKDSRNESFPKNYCPIHTEEDLGETVQPIGHNE